MFFKKLIYFSSLFGIQRISPSVDAKILHEQMGIVPRQIVEKHRGASRNSEFQITCVVSSTSEFSRNMTMVSDLTVCLTELFPANMTIGKYHHLRILNHITHFSNLSLYGFEENPSNVFVVGLFCVYYQLKLKIRRHNEETKSGRLVFLIF